MRRVEVEIPDWALRDYERWRKRYNKHAARLGLPRDTQARYLGSILKNALDHMDSL
jgi:hypothetical protein